MKITTYVIYTLYHLLTFGVCFEYELPEMGVDNPFRMGKINMIWEKAKRTGMDEKKMAELFADLTLQDRKEKTLKHKKVEGGDTDGLLEANVRADLNAILREYKLQAHFQREMSVDDVIKPGSAYNLKDDSLKDLMKNAKTEGFTAEELETLKQELGHHQMKLDEFDSLQAEYDKKTENVDNSLDNLDDQEELWHELRNKKLKLNEKDKGIKQGFETLKRKTFRKPGKEFEDPRVIHLWSLAKKSGMGEEELESVRKELGHFEHRILKTKYMQEELDKRKEKIQKAGDSDTQHLHQRQQAMQEKAKEYAATVEKHHAEIKRRIKKRIDEL